MHLVRTWRNDHEIWKWCRQFDFISDYEQGEWFKKQAQDPSTRMYKIVLKGPNEKGDAAVVALGVCGLTSICHVNRRAEFSLYIAPAFQSRGFGVGALNLLLIHGFRNLGLNMIWGEVFEGNPALKSFLDVGFKVEGERRQFYYRDGAFIDATLISIKGEEFLCSLKTSCM